MTVLRSFKLVAVALAALPVWASQASAQLEPTPAVEPPLRDSKLQDLESVASLRAVKTSAAPSSKEYAEIVRASQNFAAQVAGDDDAKFTSLASAAVTQAMASKKGLLGTESLRPMAFSRAAPFMEEQVWAMPSFQANYRKLMDAASRDGSELYPISGPPTTARIVGPGSQPVTGTGFLDCVCVGRRLASGDQFCCTGTLIGKNVVVTAGHCYACLGGGANNAVVYFGTDTSQPGKRVTGTAHRHPDYNSGGRRNDLTVIVLSEAVTGVTPRRVATTSEIDGCTFVRAVGFGNSDFASTSGFGVKRLVDVPIATVCCCNGTETADLGCDSNLELVAGFVGLGPDSCNGDSGGPVYVLVGSDARDDQAWAVAGATSRATNLATRPCGDGGVYARLDRYLAWIESLPGVQF